jgi:hypothetical protein
MLPPIHFNYEFVFQADKIENVITERMLAAKLDTRNLSAAQKMPQSLFGVSHFVPQRLL